MAGCCRSRANYSTSPESANATGCQGAARQSGDFTAEKRLQPEHRAFAPAQWNLPKDLREYLADAVKNELDLVTSTHPLRQQRFQVC